MTARFALALAAAVLVGGCGRTSEDCKTCDPTPVDVGGAAGSGGIGGSSAGTSSQAGSGGVDDLSELGLKTCVLGGPDVPLVRYSNVDLEWTLDEVIGPGPSLGRDYEDRSDSGDSRGTSAAFVQKLIDSTTARATAATLDESVLQLCDAEVEDRSSCVDTWIASRGLRLYRRPLTDEQLAGYVVQFSERAALESPLAAARSVLVSMSLSPYFVFRIELGGDFASTLEAPPGGAPPGFPSPQPLPGTRLSSYEIAARLSHFATRMAPDAALLRSALVDEPRAIVAQLDRLLQTPHAARARALQHLEWLKVEGFGVSGRSDDAGLAMRDQTTAFVMDVLERRNGSLLELLSSSRQPVNGRLAEHYGIEAAVGEAFELVDLDPSYYAGVLGQGSWLWRYPSPTLRGIGVYSRLLCWESPPPPLDHPPVAEGQGQGATPRERVSNATSSQPACQGCHTLFDPAGFALEAFDDEGRLTGYGTTGELRLPRSGETLAVAGPAELGTAIAASYDAKVCAAQRYVEHLLERRLDSESHGFWFECLSSIFDSGDLDLNQLARQVVVSDAMQRMSRPGSTAIGVSQAVDPIDHALDETQGLMGGFADADRARLDQYLVSLRELQSLQPL